MEKGKRLKYWNYYSVGVVLKNIKNIKIVEKNIEILYN